MIHLASKFFSQQKIKIYLLNKNYSLIERQRKLRKAEMLRQLDAEKLAAEGREKEKEEKRPAISRGKSRDVERGIN